MTLKQMVEKLYRWAFESNGEKSIVEVLRDGEERMNRIETKAGNAIEHARKIGKFCGVPAEYDPKREGEACPMNEIVDGFRFFKKTWKLFAAAVFILAFSIVILAGWNGVEQNKRLMELATQVGKINAALNPR